MIESKEELANLSDEELRQLEEELIEQSAAEHNQQLAIKVLLNSLYGALGNAGFRYFMIEMAQSVTLSGQVVIQWIERKINEFVSKKTGLEKDRIVLIDTDSVVIDLEDLVNQVCPEHYTREQRLDFLIKFGEKVMDPYIDHCYQEFAEYINAFQQKMHMKRENVISRMISVAKKMYCMEVYNSEGKQFSVDDPYMKIMGLKLVKSDTPAVMRQALRKALPILLQKSEAEVQDYVEEVRKTFGQYTVEEIAFPKTANNVSAYDRKIVKRLYENATDKIEKANLADKLDVDSLIYTKKTPIAVKGALIYNHLIEKYALGLKYQPIRDGDKVKFVYLKKGNPIGESVIAFVDKLPDEFKLREWVDYQTMFEKVSGVGGLSDNVRKGVLQEHGESLPAVGLVTEEGSDLGFDLSVLERYYESRTKRLFQQAGLRNCRRLPV